MCSTIRLIEVFENCAPKTFDELKHIYEVSQQNIFADSHALQFLKCFILEYHSGSITEQYIQLHEQFDEYLRQSNLGSVLTLDDLDDCDGLPKPLEDKLHGVIMAKMTPGEKDQKLRVCLQKIQASLRNDMAMRREYKLFQLSIKKALKQPTKTVDT